MRSFSPGAVATIALWKSAPMVRIPACPDRGIPRPAFRELLVFSIVLVFCGLFNFFLF